MTLMPVASPAVTYTQTRGVPESSIRWVSGFMKYMSSSGWASICMSRSCLATDIALPGIGSAVLVVRRGDAGTEQALSAADAAAVPIPASRNLREGPEPWCAGPGPSGIPLLGTPPCDLPLRDISRDIPLCDIPMRDIPM